MKKILEKGISCILSVLVLLQGWLVIPNGAAALEEDSSLETTTTAITENLGQVQEWEQFQYQASENEVTIVGYTGIIEGTLEIPAEIDGFPVISDYFCGQRRQICRTSCGLCARAPHCNLFGRERFGLRTPQNGNGLAGRACCRWLISLTVNNAPVLFRRKVVAEILIKILVEK